MHGQDRRAKRALVGAAHAFNVVAVNPFPQRSDCRLAGGKTGQRAAGIIGAQPRDPAFAVRVDIDEVRIGQHGLIALDHKRAERGRRYRQPISHFRGSQRGGRRESEYPAS